MNFLKLKALYMKEKEMPLDKVLSGKWPEPVHKFKIFECGNWKEYNDSSGTVKNFKIVMVSDTDFLVSIEYTGLEDGISGNVKTSLIYTQYPLTSFYDLTMPSDFFSWIEKQEITQSLSFVQSDKSKPLAFL